MGQSDTRDSSKCQNGPLDVTLEEKELLEFVKANPKATQEQIAEHIGKSSRTVKRITANLCQKGYLKRERGKRNGVWITTKPELRRYEIFLQFLMCPES